MNAMMQFFAGAALILAISTSSAAFGQQSGTSIGSTRKVKLSTGESIITTGSDTDHVVIKDAQGEIMAESWCDSGTFDAYLALFTKLKESVARGDRSAIVKLVAYPLRVNAKKPLIFRNEASLSKGYNKVFTQEVLEGIGRAEPAAVFCRNGQGMLGDGVVWAAVSAGTAKAVVINQ